MRREEDGWWWFYFYFFCSVLTLMIWVLISLNTDPYSSLCPSGTPKLLQFTDMWAVQCSCHVQCGTAWICHLVMLSCLLGCLLDKVLLTHHLLKHESLPWLWQVIYTSFPGKKKAFSVSNDLLIAYLFSQIFSCQNILIKVWPALNNQENNYCFQFYLIFDCQII